MCGYYAISFQGVLLEKYSQLGYKMVSNFLIPRIVMQRIAAKVNLPLVITLLGMGLALALGLILSVYTQPLLTRLLSSPSLLHLVILTSSLFLSLIFAFLAYLYLLSRNRNHELMLSNHALKLALKTHDEAKTARSHFQSALNQSQKLQAMGTLAGGIAHDFNNLIYAIRGYAEMCRNDSAKNSLMFKNLSKVIEACARGQDLISRILAFSRHQQHEITPLSLKEAMESALALLRPTIPASVTLKVELGPDLILLANQTQLHQVIVNLITNAVDAMDGEGEIDITAKEIAPNDTLLLEFPDLVQRHYAMIQIHDSGHGMDSGILNRVFEPFFTTKEVGKGTGLGLSIVHNIMMEHHGAIRAESKLGDGATFTLLLPLHIEH
jgi:signal transduction histidine kinase